MIVCVRMDKMGCLHLGPQEKRYAGIRHLFYQRQDDVEYVLEHIPTCAQKDLLTG